MNTVTYGVKCASFFAVRTLRQLDMDEKSNFSLPSEVTFSNAYIYDIVTGTSSLYSAAALKSQLIKMFESCGMQLHNRNLNSKNSVIFYQKKFHLILMNPVKPLCIIWLLNEIHSRLESPWDSLRHLPNERSFRSLFGYMTLLAISAQWS